MDVKVRANLPPHIYAISDAAYQDMRRSGRSQCCVVSGESGSGESGVGFAHYLIKGAQSEGFTFLSFLLG